MRRTIPTLVCLAGILALHGTAVAAPGDLFVTESEGGSILEFSEGGDLSGAARYATGLSTPVAICRGPDGEIYVAEYSTGEITILPEGGGDLTDEDPFAYNIGLPTALWCDDERIITATFIGGKVPQSLILDVTEGENVLEINVDTLLVAQNLSFGSSVVVDDMDNMFAVGGNTYDITAGGDLTGDPAHSTGIALVHSMFFDGMLLGTEYQGNGVWDFTAGGDLSLGTPWATVPDNGADGVEAVLDAGELGQFALSGNAIYDITGGGDHSGDAAFATGLDAGVVGGADPLLGLEGMLHHVCSTNEDCADDDRCNGDELCINNSCQDPEGPPDCDDGDVCTADSCDMEDGCLNEAIAGCCHDDFDCAIDEVCDAGTNECVPTDPTGGEEEGSEGGSEDTGDPDPDPDPDPTVGGSTGIPMDPNTTDTDGSDSDTDDPSATEGGEGCACTTTGTPNPSAFLLLGALGLILRRRR